MLGRAKPSPDRPSWAEVLTATKSAFRGCSLSIAKPQAMSDTHEAMKRRYAALMMAELAWLDDLASEDAQKRTRVNDGQVTNIRKPRGGEVRIWPSIVTSGAA